MKKRRLHVFGLVLLAVLVALIVWQGSFTFGEYAPANPQQTFLYWTVSTLVFLLAVTLAFMLFRTGIKLYIERQSNREGSRIRTKMVVAALGLSFLPVSFLVIWSYYVLNRNLDKWFSRPAEDARADLVEVGDAMEREARSRVEAQALWLAGLPETASYLATGARAAGRFDRLCKEHGIPGAYIEKSGGDRLPVCGSASAPAATGEIVVRAGILAAGPARGDLVVKGRMSADLEARRESIQNHLRAYDQLALNRKSTRNFYLLLLLLITLFILFVATWLALFLARQISIPISALLAAAGEVRRGNLAHQVEVRAIDELATLVRAFNEMTRDLEANSRELARRSRFTEAILESIPTGVISVSADGRIHKVNRALMRIFPGEVVSRATRLEDLFSREDTAEIRYLMKRARRTGLASREMELATESRRLHLSVTVSALEEKLTSGFVVVVEDTSELLRAQKSAAWHEVARRVAHEIKNPLTPIALCADRIHRQLERAQASPAPDRILRECAATISREVESVRTLVDEFSQLARFPSAQPAPCDLNEVVENALAVFSGRLDGIDLRAELSPGLPPVNIDREQFKRVVVNLVDNAAEAMQDSLVKHLLIATQPTAADTVELIVADTGCGVSTEEKEKLFLPYFSTKGRGTGLGLAIVSRILADHSAHIRVEDNVPAGARFIVEIPCAGVDAELKAAGIKA